MSVNETGKKTYLAGATVAANRLVALSSGNVIHATANVQPIGVSLNGGASGAPIAVKLLNPTVEVTASTSISAGAYVTPTTDGKAVTAGNTQEAVGIALEAAGADGDIIEVMLLSKAATGGDFIAGNAASSGVGSIKMANANAADSAGFLTFVLIDGTSVYVPYFADATP